MSYDVQEIFRIIHRIGGSVVECSPATRAARVRFPADAIFVVIYSNTLNVFEG